MHPQGWCSWGTLPTVELLQSWTLQAPGPCANLWARCQAPDMNTTVPAQMASSLSRDGKTMVKGIQKEDL